MYYEKETRYYIDKKRGECVSHTKLVLAAKNALGGVFNEEQLLEFIEWGYIPITRKNCQKLVKVNDGTPATVSQWGVKIGNTSEYAKACLLTLKLCARAQETPNGWIVC